MANGERNKKVADFLYQTGKRVGVFDDWLPDLNWFIQGAVSCAIVYGFFRLVGGKGEERDQRHNVSAHRMLKAEESWANYLAHAAIAGNMANVADALAQDSQAYDGNVAQGALKILSEMGDDGPRRLVEMVEKVAEDEKLGRTGRDDVRNFVDALQMSRDLDPHLTTQIGRARVNRFANRWH